MASGSATVRRHRRIANGFMVLVGLGIAVAVIFAVQFAGAAQERALRANARETLSVQAQVLNGLMEKFRLLPTLVGRRPEVSALFKSDDPRNKMAALSAIRHDAAMTGAMDIVLLRLDGTLLLSGTGILTEPVARDSELLSAVLQGRLGRQAIGFASNSRAYVFSTGLRDRSGELFGVIAVLVDLANLEQIWSLSALPVLVIDQRGIILVSNRAPWRMQKLGDIEEVSDGGEANFKLNGAVKPFVQVRQALPELGWEMRVLADATPIARARTLAAASVIFSGLALGFVLLGLLNQRLAVIRRQRSDKANALRLERVVRDRTKALTEEVEEHKQTENTLRQTQDELIQTGKLAALGQMSTALSHEFNQPLAATKSYADNALILRERSREDEAKENIRLISKMADRMAVISRHLRNFGRKPKSRLTSIFVPGVIDEAVEVLSSRLREQNATVKIVHAKGDIWARAGQVRLQQVLVNLIANGLDAAREHPELPIEIQTGTKGKKVIITVRDFGHGIAPGDMEHIFDPFFTTKDPGQGLGLGLSISYNIIKDFGGRLSGANHKEQGAIFRIELDLVPEPGTKAP